MSDPYKELARSLKNMAKSQSKNTVMGLHAELGTITTTGLKLDRFKHELKDYLIADYLSLPEVLAITSYAGTGPHTHEVPTPEPLLALSTGDRVLAIPVNDGQDYVVVARVVANG